MEHGFIYLSVDIHEAARFQRQVLKYKELQGVVLSPDGHDSQGNFP